MRNAKISSAPDVVGVEKVVPQTDERLADPHSPTEISPAAEYQHRPSRLQPALFPWRGMQHDGDGVRCQASVPSAVIVSSASVLG